MKQGVLILGASQDQLCMIRTAREMGLFTAVLDGNPSAPGLRSADFSAPINFSDVAAAISWCENLIRNGNGLVGVCTMGSDVSHILAAVATHFGWIGPSEETARVATHKFFMKQRFVERGIPVPKFALVNSAAEARSFWQEWGCRAVVLKPTDRAGSKGVSIIKEFNYIAAAFDCAKNLSLNGEVLLEEFILGSQISTETIIYNDYAATPGFADRVYEGMECFHPQVMENGGWLPSSLSVQMVDKVSRLSEDAARALGIVQGVAKGDVVICPQRGAMMIEMAARLSGGDFSESLVPMATGVNYIRTVLEIAVGRTPDLAALQPKPLCHVANRYFFPPPGKLEAIDGAKVCQAQPGIVKFEIYPRIGDTLPKVDSHARRAGVFVVNGASRAEIQQTVDLVYQTLKFKIDGSWRTVEPAAAFVTGD